MPANGKQPIIRVGLAASNLRKTHWT